MTGLLDVKAVGVNEDDVRENVMAIIKASSDPVHCQEQWEKLLQVKVSSRSELVLGVLMRGWQTCASDKRSNCTNVGVVAALVLSFVSGMSLDLPTPIETDEAWDREAMYNVYTVMLATSTALSLACVILSIIWVNHSTQFVTTAEDYLAFEAGFPTAIIDTVLVISVLSFAVAYLMGVVLVQDTSTAYVNFFICLAVFLGCVIFYLLRLTVVKGRSFRKCEMQLVAIRALLPKIVQEHKAGLVKTDNVEAFQGSA